MVAGKHAVSGGADILSIGSKTNTSKPKKKNESDFKTMLDKNAQNTQNTQNTDSVKADAANKENAPISGEEAAVPKKEETVEENGMELEVLAQFVVIPEQERAALNWAEEIPADVTEKAAGVEGVSEIAVGTAETNTPKQADTQATLTKEEAGLTGEEPKNAADSGAEAAKAGEKQDATDGRQTEAVKEVKTQDVAETKPDDAAAKPDAKTGAEETQGTAKEEVKTAQDISAHTTAPKEVQEDDMLNFKVGDTVKLADPKAAEEIADTILVRATENNKEFEMQLNPEELGKVRIKMVFEEGKIHIAMTCDNQKAMDLLSATSSRLKELIEERTGSEVNVQVEQESETPYHEQEKQDGRENAQQEASHRQNGKEKVDSMDFIQQLRLGLVETE